MQTNALPHFDDSVNTTGCCYRFNPDGWDGQELHLENKPFIRATTRSLMHVPLNMGRVFARVQGHIDAAKAFDPENFIVLSRDISPWQTEHLFSSSVPVREEETVTLSGDFLTKVFEGPYRDAATWFDDIREQVRSKGHEPGNVYFFYTTCPKCARVYGKNYVVGVAEMI